jgi:hypothetical protein
VPLIVVYSVIVWPPPALETLKVSAFAGALPM